MTEEQLKILVESDARSKSNTHRIDTLEKNQDVLNNLATSMAVMAEQQKNMSGKVDSIEEDVKELKQAPADRWDKVVMTIITVIVTALATLVINSMIG